MKVKVANFCALATSPAWQSWLFHADQELYRSFNKRLHISRGCDENREIMVDMLKAIDRAGKSDELIKFLRQHQPSALIEPIKLPVSLDKHRVFPGFVPGLLTYPHRHIVVDDNLKDAVKRFLDDKGKSDSLILDDTAYIEYLNISEDHLIEKIPETYWCIRAYRKNTQKVL